jgi:hypothetical protein
MLVKVLKAANLAWDATVAVLVESLSGVVSRTLPNHQGRS